MPSIGQVGVCTGSIKQDVPEVDGLALRVEIKPGFGFKEM